jgi:predicted O-methyltransferase YrrM
MRRIIRQALEWVAYPLVWLTAPLYYFLARTGAWIGICRRFGFEPIRLYFYQPVPEYEAIPPAYFESPQDLPGVRLDEDLFSATLTTLSAHAHECGWPEQATAPGQYYAQNTAFGYSSAVLLHTMIRAHRSRRLVEVGSGYSTLIAHEALKLNHPDGSYQLTCIEPYPHEWLKARLSGDSAQLIVSRAQDVPLDTYLNLAENDILFIDSSHVSKLASDVNFLYLRVLPRLKPGVIVHIHDIHLPYEYPEVYFRGRVKYYWNEQYLLQAFLSGGDSHFEIILPGYLIQKDRSDDFRRAFPDYDPARHRLTSSFWMKKVR